MHMPSQKSDARRRRHAEKRVQERAVVREFSIQGETVTTVQHHCLIVGRSLDMLRLISDEPLVVGERVDIIFNLTGREGSKTISGIPRNLAVAYESSGYLVDIELIRDKHAMAWARQFH